MKKNYYDISDIALLQAYILELFKLSNKCEHSLKFTKEYLEEKFDEGTKNEILEFLQQRGIDCDCGIIDKLNIADEDEAIQRAKH
jgi:hypothetical protein